MQNCIDLAREPRFDKFDHFCSGLWEATFPRTVCRVMLLEVISAALGNLVYALGKCFFSFRLLRILWTLRPDLMARVPAHWTINDFGVRDFAGIVAHFGVREEQKVDQLITFCVGTV